jgi:lysophospholipase L1-like esterase
MILLLLALLSDEPKKGPFDAWEKAISAIEKRDRESPPPEGAVFFCGSSSMVRWPLEKSFPGWKVSNRGFGGSKVADSAHFAPRIITGHKPGAIVFYAGDNDIAGGKAPEAVLEDFRAFVKAVREKLPDVPIYFLSIKPSVARWKLWEKMKQANGLIRKECEAPGRKLGYIDLSAAMLGEDGKPKPELFVKDGLHLSAAGYELWSEAVRKRLKADGVK